MKTNRPEIVTGMRAGWRGSVLVSAAAMALATGAFFTPWLAASHPLAALALRSFFSGVCHQNPARSFVVHGSHVAVCVRCLGIYCGLAMGACFSLLRGLWKGLRKWPVRRIFLGALLVNLLDVGSEAIRLHGNMPLPRFLLGASLGIAAGLLLGWAGESWDGKPERWQDASRGSRAAPAN
ncbi:MAG TPA: DUF2085 domain-containing protein [Acidobacteriaceae bacterium]|nr:DUF2085 domain-containing protein [Acidobacteriaceae bacterium]